MPAVARLGDQCTGHGCFPPRPSSSGASTVFANGIAVHRQDDAWESHCCGPACHGSTTSAGSGTVFVEGKPVARIGDAVACGSAIAEGSENIFIGG